MCCGVLQCSSEGTQDTIVYIRYKIQNTSTSSLDDNTKHREGLGTYFSFNLTFSTTLDLTCVVAISLCTESTVQPWSINSLSIYRERKRQPNYYHVLILTGVKLYFYLFIVRSRRGMIRRMTFS